MEILLPFISFVFGDFTFYESSSFLIQSWFHSKLLQLIQLNLSLRDPVLKRLIGFIPLYSGSNFFIMKIFEELIAVLDSSENYVQELLQHLLSFLCQLRSTKQPIGSALLLLDTLSKKAPFIWFFPSLILVLGWLLFGSSFSEQRLILNYLNKGLDLSQLVSISDTFRQISIFLVFPLLQIITFPSAPSFLQSSAGSLLQKVEMLIDAPSIKESSISKSIQFEFTQKTFDSCRGIFAMFSKGERFLIEVLKTTTSVYNCEIWLKGIQKHLSRKDELSDFFLFFISPFLFHVQPKVRISCINLMIHISEVSPFKGIQFLSMLLYQLKHEMDPHVQLHLIFSIPTLANHDNCVGPVLQILLPLANTTTLRAVAIRALQKLWERHERVFFKIQPLLISYSVQIPLDVKMSIAVSIRDICKKKPERGKELVGIISKILQTESHPTPVSLSLEALIILCEEQVVDFQTAWSVISKPLSEDLRPIVSAHVISFLGCGAPLAEMKTEDEAREIFVGTILEKLWNALTSRNPSVRKEAFQSLNKYAKFNPELVGLSNTILTSKYVEGLADSFPQSRLECEKLIQTLLEFEVSNRRALMQSEDIANPSAKLLVSLPEFFQQLRLKANTTSSRSALAGSLLWSYQAPKERLARKLLINKSNEYRKIMTELLSDISSRADPRDWTIRVMLIPAWVSFMNSCSEIYFQGEIAKAASSGEAIDERTAIDRVCNELISELKANCEGTPKIAEVSTIALAALALVIPPTNYNQIENIATLLMELLQKGEHEWIQYGSVLGLGTLTFAIHITDEKFKQIIELLLEHLEKNENSWVKFGCGISLGLCLSNLYKANQINHSPETKESIEENLPSSLFEKIIQVLLSTCGLGGTQTKSNNETNLGCLIGLSYSVVAFKISGRHQQLLDIYYEMGKILDQILLSVQTETQQSINLEKNYLGMGVLLALGSVQSVLFELELISTENVKKHIEKFVTLLEILVNRKEEENLSSLGIPICLGLGNMVHGSLASNFTFEKNWIGGILNHFFTLINSPDVHVEYCLGAIFGTSSILGSILVSSCGYIVNQNILNATYLSPIFFSDPANSQLVELAVNVLKQSLNHSNQRIARHSAWVLGSLSRPLPPTAFTTDNSLMLALPNTSLIKTLFLKLDETIKQGSGQGNANQIESILRCLGPLKRLPSVRWNSLLSQLMKFNLGTGVRLECVRFALQRANESNLIPLLDEWTETSKLTLFEESIQFEFYKVLPELLVIFSSSRGRKLVFDLLGTFDTVYSGDHSTRMKKLQSLESCLGQSVISNPILADLQEILFILFEQWPEPLDLTTGNVIQENCIELSLISRCFAQISKEIVATRLDIKENSSIPMIAKIVYVGCELVASGALENTFLKKCRTWCVSQPSSNGILSRSLMKFLLRPLKKFSILDQSKWILDTLDILTICSSPPLALDLLLLILLLWSKTDASLLFLDQLEIYTSNPQLLAHVLPIFFNHPNLSSQKEVVIQKFNNLLDHSNVRSIRPILLSTFNNLLTFFGSQTLTLNLKNNNSKIWVYLNEFFS